MELSINEIRMNYQKHQPKHLQFLKTLLRYKSMARAFFGFLMLLLDRKPKRI